MHPTMDTIQHTAARVGKGLIVPLLTPLAADGESLDIPTLETLAEFLIRSGVDGLNTCGTTGEFALLKHSERRQVTEVVVKLAAGRLPVLAQTGAITTAETVALTRHARECGADAVSVVTPYYYPLTDQALVDHYVAVSSAVPDFPIFLYNIPQKAGNNLSSALVAEITRQCPNVVGIKDTSGNLGQLAQDRMEVKRRFHTLVGADHLILSAMANGADGAIAGFGNVFPELFVALFKAFAAGDLTAAGAFQDKITIGSGVMGNGMDFSLLKGVLRRRGLDTGPTRRPLMNASEQEIDRCVADMLAAGIDLSRIV
jgi:dihydrodipicolinate synthase/N-acetylneuraminate lyase